MADGKIKVNISTAGDSIAEIVMERFRIAREHKTNHTVFEELSVQQQLEMADKQYRKQYDCEDKASIAEAFGIDPKRYFGLSFTKTRAAANWYADLFITSLDSVFTCSPSPNPTLDKKTLDRIRKETEAQLINKMQTAGIFDPNVLIGADGKPDKAIIRMIQEQVDSLKRVEQAKIVSEASTAAANAQKKMRDILIESNFRQEYKKHTLNRIKYGVGFIRFPEWRRVETLVHKNGKAERVFEIKPMFRAVSPFNIFTTPDGDCLKTCNGITEIASLTKAEILSLAFNGTFDEQAVTKVMEKAEYSLEYRSNWIQGFNESLTQDNTYWTPDEKIDILIHEGFFYGDELREHGVEGVEDTEYVNACVTVIAGETVQVEFNKAPNGKSRSYHAAPFCRVGEGVWDTVGIPAMLQDTQQRINRMFYSYESNLDWATRPPLLSNRSAFENASDAMDIVPGETYEVNDRFGVTGNMPDPVRPIRTVSAQYHLVMSEINTLIRMADEECGIPAYAYGAQDFGRASLGEYSQRMTNALRTIKDAALEEDINIIEPSFRALFDHLMQEDKGFAEGQDINLMIRGMTGILNEDQSNKRASGVLGLAIQANQAGKVDDVVVDYLIRKELEGAGVPVDALGISDPVIDRALAVAATTPQQGQPIPSLEQVPQLDGRSSGVNPMNVALPNGGTKDIRGMN